MGGLVIATQLYDNRTLTKHLFWQYRISPWARLKGCLTLLSELACPFNFSVCHQLSRLILPPLFDLYLSKPWNWKRSCQSKRLMPIFLDLQWPKSISSRSQVQLNWFLPFQVHQQGGLFHVDHIFEVSEQGLTWIDTKFDTTYSYSVDVVSRVIFSWISRTYVLRFPTKLLGEEISIQQRRARKQACSGAWCRGDILCWLVCRIKMIFRGLSCEWEGLDCIVWLGSWRIRAFSVDAVDASSITRTEAHVRMFISTHKWISPRMIS